MRPDPALAAGHCKALAFQLRARFLRFVPRFARELEKPEVVLVENVGFDRGAPP
jgi:hypothetical protein